MKPCEKCNSTRLDVWVKKNPTWADHGGYCHAGVTCLECGHQIHDWHKDRSTALHIVMDKWNGTLPLFEME